VNSSNFALAGSNVITSSGDFSAVLGSTLFTNHGLVGVGRIDANALDVWGESLGSVSGLQVTDWTIGNGSYSGTFNILPDRGYNAGTTFSNYAARVQRVDFSFTPYTGSAATGVPQDQFTLTYNPATSYKFTFDLGDGLRTTTGLIPDSSRLLNGVAVPFVTVSDGTPTLPAQGSDTAINRVSLDAERSCCAPMAPVG
jgi:hypothetical protein